ncbi:MAG: hypothetical protein ACRD15_00790 [Vicinamibacterales bacterium]
MNASGVVLVAGAVGGMGTALIGRFLANDDAVLAIGPRNDVLVSWGRGGRRVRGWSPSRLTSALRRTASGSPDSSGTLRPPRRPDQLRRYFPIIDREAMTTAQWRHIINLERTYLMTRAPSFHS